MEAESFTCTATVAKKRLAPRRGGCRWLLPKSSRGKQLVIRVTYRFQGVTGKTAAYAFRVR